jgi:hypothetical protein
VDGLDPGRGCIRALDKPAKLVTRLIEGSFELAPKFLRLLLGLFGI